METLLESEWKRPGKKHRRRWRIILKWILEKREVCCLKMLSVSKIMGK